MVDQRRRPAVEVVDRDPGRVDPEVPVDRGEKIPGVNPPLEYNGPAYLGDAWQPFVVSGDPSAPNFAVPDLGLPPDGDRRLDARVRLRRRFDDFRREFDRRLEMDALDAFEAQAVGLLTDPAARRAFDLTLEPDATRDRYGRNAWGQQLLMARRLVEAGGRR